MAHHEHQEHQAPLHAPISEVVKYLQGLHFPAEKSDLLAQAKLKNAPENVIRAIEIMYPEKFTSLDDIERNLRSSEARAEARSAHHSEHHD